MDELAERGKASLTGLSSAVETEEGGSESRNNSLLFFSHVPAGSSALIRMIG